MREDDEMIGSEILLEPLWAETILPWLKLQADKLSEAGVECELSMRGTVEYELRPGILVQNPRAGAGSVYFASVEPCDMDEETGFLLDLSVEKEPDETQRTVQRWRFPLLLFPQISRDDWDLFDYICLFERLRNKKGLGNIHSVFSQDTFEIVRLNGLFSILEEMGADPRMRIPDDSYPRIEVTDEKHLFRFSCMRIDEDEENWILTAELFHAQSEQAEDKPLIRFDIPEFGGLLETESYGRLIEIMESLTA